VAAGIGAALWALITVATNYQIGFMALGVGFLVGHSVRAFGKGVDTGFGVLGAVLALAGCLAGKICWLRASSGRYAIAVYEGSRFSFRRIPEEETRRLTH